MGCNARTGVKDAKQQEYHLLGERPVVLQFILRHAVEPKAEGLSEVASDAAYLADA